MSNRQCHVNVKWRPHIGAPQTCLADARYSCSILKDAVFAACEAHHGFSLGYSAPQLLFLACECCMPALIMRWVTCLGDGIDTAANVNVSVCLAASR